MELPRGSRLSSTKLSERFVLAAHEVDGTVYLVLKQGRKRISAPFSPLRIMQLGSSETGCLNRFLASHSVELVSFVQGLAWILRESDSDALRDVYDSVQCV
jgi:hypothetical protein